VLTDAVILAGGIATLVGVVYLSERLSSDGRGNRRLRRLR
jgi:hypothetical protein